MAENVWCSRMVYRRSLLSRRDVTVFSMSEGRRCCSSAHIFCDEDNSKDTIVNAEWAQ